MCGRFIHIVHRRLQGSIYWVRECLLGNSMETSTPAHRWSQCFLGHALILHTTPVDSSQCYERQPHFTPAWAHDVSLIIIFVYYYFTILFELLIFCRVQWSGNVAMNDNMLQICEQAVVVYL
jgi:hypothetical protein